MNRQYYIGQNGQTLGPFALHELKGKSITRQTLIWYDGLAEWIAAEKDPDVFALLFSERYQKSAENNSQVPPPPINSTTASGSVNSTPSFTYTKPLSGIGYYFFCFQNYFKFSGRARRSEFWYFFLFNMIFGLFFYFCAIAMNFAAIYYFFQIVVFIPYLAVAVRRLHDVGKSGWYFIIPIYNLILFCSDSVYGTNQYGPNPKGQG